MSDYTTTEHTEHTEHTENLKDCVSGVPTFTKFKHLVIFREAYHQSV